MVHKNLIINSKRGLDARAASVLVEAANRFLSRMLIEKDNKKVNAKSIMGVLSLAVKNGETIRIIITGEDEQAAFEAVASLVEGGFGGN